MEERRIAHRYRLPLPVIVKQSLLSTPDEMCVTTRDVSTAGLYFTSTERLDVGMKLDLSLTLPSEITQGSAVIIDAQARVLRVDERHVGDDEHFGIAAAIDKFNVSRVAVDFALHKAEQVVVKRSSATASGRQ